jgi:hypothetical protein
MSRNNKPITGQSEFQDIDDALYNHEGPYYHACAGGTHFEVTPEWTRERARLTALWHLKSPYKVKEELAPPSILQRIMGWFK